MFNMSPWGKPRPVEETKKLIDEAAKTRGWLQLKKDIVQFNEQREQLIKKMENNKDPLYQRYVQMYKESMPPQEFAKNRLKIFAICNQRAMQECLSVDEMVNVVPYGHPQNPIPIVPEEFNTIFHQEPKK